jgi:hypothetical protein
MELNRIATVRHIANQRHEDDRTVVPAGVVLLDRSDTVLEMCWWRLQWESRPTVGGDCSGRGGLLAVEIIAGE